MEQKEELATLDWSILFLLLLITGILLSFSATVEQRDALAQLLCYGREDTTDVYPQRRLASVLVTGATGFFAWVACRSAQRARCQGSCLERQSTHANLLAAFLVFGAACIRLEDLEHVRCCGIQGVAQDETLTRE